MSDGKNLTLDYFLKKVLIEVLIATRNDCATLTAITDSYYGS